MADGAAGESLGKRLFIRRLELIGVLDQKISELDEKPIGMGPQYSDEDPSTVVEVRSHTAFLLHGEVSAMNLDNFVVRPKRRFIEKYAKAETWAFLPGEAYDELNREVAGLPSELDPEAEEAKRFDLIVLNLQLALLRAEPAFPRLRDQVIAIAGLLEEKAAIPMVQAQLVLIQDIQTEEWWQNATTPMLEKVRRRLRALIRLIEKKNRKPIYTEFVDEIGAGIEIELPGISTGEGFERFLAKARAFLRDHQDHIAIHKLRMNKTMTAVDLDELEKMLEKSGVGGTDQIAQAKKDCHGLGLFVRSLVGLDREAAKEALGEFTSAKPMTSSQIEFTNLIVNHLTEKGAMDASLLYESPFTDVVPQGPEALFTQSQLDTLMAALQRVKAAAQAA